MAGHNVAIYHRNFDDQNVNSTSSSIRMKDEGAGYFDPRPGITNTPAAPESLGTGRSPPTSGARLPMPDFNARPARLVKAGQSCGRRPRAGGAPANRLRLTEYRASAFTPAEPPENAPS